MRKYNIKNFIFHPFFLGLYPVIALLGHNISEMRVTEAARSLLFMFIVIAVSVMIMRLIFRSWQRAALVTTLIVIAFFSYGFLYDFLQQNFPGLQFGRHRFLVPSYLVVVSIGLWWIKKIQDLDTATQALNLVGIIALIFPLYQIVSHGFITSIEVSAKRAEITSSSGPAEPDDFVYPDIYYIILDAYTRNDVLQDVYGYDNLEFLNRLRELGFYIAECSQSNYSKTSHSLTSSLNINYLDVLAGGNARNLKSPATWIRFNEVKKILDSLGYTTVAFSTGFPATELTEVDIYLQPDDDDLANFESKQPTGVINNFEAMLIGTSGLLLTDSLTLFDIDILPNTLKKDIKSLTELSPVQQHYVQVFHAFDELEKIASLPTPKFVFAHIIIPHKPYIFSSDGTYMPRQEQNKEAYVNQLSYVNQRIIPIVTKIIEDSNTPPIIIIQGDHGSPEVEFTPLRVMILNAYYLPNGGNIMLYSRISPVNTFRLIFDYYFGTEYGLLEDVSYNSKSKEDTLDFEIVTNLCDQ